MTAVRHLVRAARPKQWVKNGFVAAPLLFSGRFTDGADVLMVVAAIACFCALSSAVYLVNDVLDAREDQFHPEKRHRPIAAGLLSPRVAVGTAVVLGVAALAAALMMEPWFAAGLGAYCANAILYTTAIKHEPILDVFSIALGFVIRVVAGALVIMVRPSAWILICSGLLALMMALGKRRAEILELDEDATRHRVVLELSLIHI